MLSYQSRFFEPTQELTSTRFSELIISDAVVKTIAEVRQLGEQMRQLEEEIHNLQLLHDANPDPQEPMNAELLSEIEQKRAQLNEKEAQRKRRKNTLPLIMWQATFDETLSAKGQQLGRWRKQAAARLNGLFMLDVDHVQQPRELFNSWWQPTLDALPEDGAWHQNAEAIEQWAAQLGVLLVHVTPSGHGLRLVAVADASVGNLADNQSALAARLGVEGDAACKDASRGSFCCSFDDILFINSKTLFNYDNPEFDTKFGPEYRRGNSSATAVSTQPAAAPAGTRPAVAAPLRAPAAATDGQNAAVGDGRDARPTDYKGVSYERIISQWFADNGGEPAVGGRHLCLLKLASAVRYITDNNKDFLTSSLLQHPVCQSYAADEEGRRDLAAIADSVCQKQLWHSIPKAFARVLERAGVQLAAAGGDAETEEAPALDYDAYARRLLPLLADSPGLREAVSFLPDRLKLGGVLAATAMLGTYLSRTWWEHFDGKLYRLSYLVYIIGGAASGKSFITRLDPLLMAPLQYSDKVGRAAEQQYKEEQKRRKSNEKLPEQPHPVIRYCPSSTSNAILYRRLQDAVDKDVTDPTTNEPLQLHLITVESELATALRAQVGSWAGKADLELKSFHNELAGVDYANAESTNGIMQVNWNQVVSGTQESMSRKVTPRNVLDGLVTRLTLFPMPENDYVMIERRSYHRDFDMECRLRQLGYKLEQVKGELSVGRLVDFCYEYEEQLTKQARLEQDKCLDYFRKRIPVIMMRNAIVRLVLRQLDKAVKGEDLTVDDSDLEYARLIGDWALEAQMYMFGQMVMDALEREQAAFAPRKMHNKTRNAYNSLPESFTREQYMDATGSTNRRSVDVILKRWATDGLIKFEKNNLYTKIIKTL